MNSLPTSSLVGAGAAFGTLNLIALIASVVLTVIAYRKFVSRKGVNRRDLKDERVLGSFLRFETLMIDKILKALYIFCAIYAALFYVASVLGALVAAFSGTGSYLAGIYWGTFFFTLIVGLLILVVAEVLIRLVFESFIMIVVIAQNTTDIRKSMHATSRPDGMPGALGGRGDKAPEPMPAKGEPMEAQPVAPQDKAPSVETAPMPKSAGGFCIGCGSPLSPSDKFCKKCGKSVE